MLTPRGLSACALIGALCGAVFLGSASPASAADSVTTTGAPVGSDPYLAPSGNGGYDVQHYALDLRYNPRNHGIASAKVAIRIRAAHSLSAFSLDAGPGLRIKQVTVGGKRAAFSHPSRKLSIRGFAPVTAGQVFVVAITYAGKPRAVRDASGRGPYGWLPTTGGSVTFTEPAGTSAWLPSNDVFYDKATWSVRLTAPKGRLGVSTGKFLGRSAKRGSTVTRWAMDTPIQPYTQVVAFDNFDYSTRPIAGIPAFTAVARRAGIKVATLQQRTEDAIKWLTPRLGQYPFGSTGGIVVSGGDSAMETAGRPTYSQDSWNTSRATVLHEQAHQWFGNMLTAGNARDIWLHEGFATYLENVATAQWSRQSLDDLVHGQYVYDGWGAKWHGQFGRVSLHNPTPRYLLNTTPYYRGQAAVHALRHRLGDAAFWRVLRHLAAEPPGRTSSTSAVIARAEAVSGQRLDAWAGAWVYSLAPQRLPQAPSHKQVLLELGPELLNAAGDFVWNPVNDVAAAMRKARQEWAPMNQLVIDKVTPVKRGKNTRYFVDFQPRTGPLYPRSYPSCFVFERYDDQVLAGALLGVRFSDDFAKNAFTPRPCVAKW